MEGKLFNVEHGFFTDLQPGQSELAIFQTEAPGKNPGTVRRMKSGTKFSPLELALLLPPRKTVLGLTGRGGRTRG